MLQLFKNATTRRYAAVALSFCLLLGIFAGPLSDVLSVKAESTVLTMFMKEWGIKDQNYGANVSGLTVGETYTATMYYKRDAGSMTVKCDNTVLIDGGTTQNGAVWDEATSLLTYTFTATKASVKIGLYFSSNGNTGNWNSAYLADVRVKNAAGAIVYTTTPVYNGETLASFEGWTNGWGSLQAITLSKQTYAFFGATEPAACSHTYTDDCDATCNNCGDVRTVAGHVYDDDADTTCNTCGAVRQIASSDPNTVNVMTIYGWTNEDSLGWTTSVPNLVAGETYTLSFLWKVENGEPYFYINGSTDQRAIQGMKLSEELGATLDRAAGRVSVTFKAGANTGIGLVLNSASTGYSKAHLADVKVVDANGATVYTANTATDPEKGWGWTGWSNRWDSRQRDCLSFSDKDVSFFAGEPCTHEYTNVCDAVCNVCGVSRVTEGHIYDNDQDLTCNTCGSQRVLKIDTMTIHGWTNEDTLGWTTGVPDLVAGETYTLSFLWKVESGETYYYINDDIVNQRIIQGMKVNNSMGTTFDTTTGRVSVTFVAAENFGMGLVLNSAATGYAKANLADVKIVDANGATVYTADTTTDPDRGWGWTGWSNRWSSNQYTLSFTKQEETFFAGEACTHEYDNTQDADCNICGAIRELPKYKGLSALTIAGVEINFDSETYVYEVSVPHDHGALEIGYTVGEDCSTTEAPQILNNVQFEGGSKNEVIVSVPLAIGGTIEYIIKVDTLKNPALYVNGVYVSEWNQDGSANTIVTVKPDTTYMFSFLYKDVAGGEVAISLSGDAMYGASVNLIKDGKATAGVTFNPDVGLYTYTFTAKAESLNIGVSFTNYSSPSGVGKFEAYIADFKLQEVDANGNVVEGGDAPEIDNSFALDVDGGAWSKSSYGGGFWNIREFARAEFVTEYSLSLSDIVVDGQSLTGFHPANYNYYLTVPYTKTTLAILPELGDDGEVFVINNADGDIVDGDAALVPGENVFTIEVTNYDQTTAIYVVTITKEIEPSAYIADLTINGGELSPAFKTDVFEYTASVPFNVQNAEFESVLSDNGKLVSITGNENLEVGIPTKVVIVIENGSGKQTAYVVTVTREGKAGETERLTKLVQDAAAKITVGDYTTKEQLAKMIAEQINDSSYTVAAVDFYRLRSVTEVKDNFEVLIEGKVGYLAAVINITDGESLAQVTVTKTIPYETKEYTFTEEEVSTEADFMLTEGPDGLIVEFYTGSAKKIVIPDGVVEIAYGWLDLPDIEAWQVLVVPESVRVLPGDMLFGSYGLETVVFKDGLTELSIGTCAKLPNLQFVRLPETLEVINSYAFDCTPSLATIRIPESVKKIGGNAFAFTLMREVTVPAGVKEIGDGAFSSSFSAAMQLCRGSYNIATWYPFQNANDPRMAQIADRADKEIDWYGTLPNSPVWDTLEEALAEGSGREDEYGIIMSSPKIVTILNKDTEFGSGVFDGQGLWDGGGNTISIANGAAAEADLQAMMDANNADNEGVFAQKWGTRDMTLAEVVARAMFALDKVVLDETFAVNDILAAIAPDYFTSQVALKIEEFAINAETATATGMLVLTQGNITARIPIEKAVDINDNPDGDNGNFGDGNISDGNISDGEVVIVTIVDSTVVSVDTETGKLLVSDGTAIVRFVKALELAEGVELDFLDAEGNRITSERYEDTIIRDGFSVNVFWESELVGEFEFAITAIGDSGNGNDNDNGADNDSNSSADNGNDNDNSNDNGDVDAPVDNENTGVTSVAVTMLVLMAGAAVALLALRRRKVTE